MQARSTKNPCDLEKHNENDTASHREAVSFSLCFIFTARGSDSSIVIVTPNYSIVNFH